MKKTPVSSYRGSWPQSHCSEDYDMSTRRNDKPLVFVAVITAFQAVLLQIVVVLFFRAHPYGTELHHQHDNNQHERVHFLALFWFAGLDRNGGHPWRNQRSIMHVRHAVFHTSASDDSPSISSLDKCPCLHYDQVYFIWTPHKCGFRCPYWIRPCLLSYLLRFALMKFVKASVAINLHQLDGCLRH